MTMKQKGKKREETKNGDDKRGGVKTASILPLKPTLRVEQTTQPGPSYPLTKQ